MQHPARTLRSIRLWILFMMAGIFLSGITAFPLETELKWLLSFGAALPPFLTVWLQHVYDGVRETNLKYPYMAYGTDWLAFAHIVIALAFIGPLRDPVRNRWVIEWGIGCCIGVLPLALIMGPIRQIPFFHIVIDCSFGVIGIVPLLLVRSRIRSLEQKPGAGPYSRAAD